MNILKKFILIIAVGVLVSVLAACQDAIFDVNIESTDAMGKEDITQESPALGMENPAAAYCEGLGYSLETVVRNGGEDADCIFPNGTRCSQWDFLSGRCGREFSYCSQQGGELLDEGTNLATCTFQDGSSCSEYALFLDECQVGEDGAEESNSRLVAPQNDSHEAVQVVGWMGYVSSTPEGAQFDDYVVILPEEQVGEFGIEGSSDEVEAQISSLRDQEEPGKYAHFWGRINCGLIDYGGCQLSVEKLRVDGPGEFFEPDLVEGWQGTINSFSYDEAGAPQHDDYFRLAGEYPVQYGIDSAISAQSGERDLTGTIIALRDSGSPVRIWGQVQCGVPDAGGCTIEVHRIESEEAEYEIPLIP